MIVDGKTAPAWQAATKEGHIADLLRARAPAGEVRRAPRNPVHASVGAPQRHPGRGHAGGGGGCARMDAAGTEPLSTCSHARSSSRRVVTRRREPLPSPGCSSFRRARGRREPWNRWLAPWSPWSRTRRPSIAPIPTTIAAVQLGEKLAAALPDEPRAPCPAGPARARRAYHSDRNGSRAAALRPQMVRRRGGQARADRAVEPGRHAAQPRCRPARLGARYRHGGGCRAADVRSQRQACTCRTCHS